MFKLNQIVMHSLQQLDGLPSPVTPQKLSLIHTDGKHHGAVE